MVSKLFAPKYKQFFKLFEDTSIKLEALSALLNKMVLASDKEKAASTNAEIKSLYQEIQDITSETLRQVQENFITPFDREDIVELITALKGMSSHINTTARRMMMYSMFPSDDLVSQFGVIVEDGGSAVNRAMHLLRKGKMNTEMKELIKNLYDYEDQADDLYNEGIMKVLNDDNDFKTFFKEKDIYQKMELITDELENVGNVLESIMIKYA